MEIVKVTAFTQIGKVTVALYMADSRGNFRRNLTLEETIKFLTDHGIEVEE